MPSTPSRSRTAGPLAARGARAAGTGLLILFISLALIEGGLQVAARWVPDRSGVWRPDAELRVLCAGDSHTWGAQVEREESYPAQLQRHLDRVEPGVYSVVNQGLPGMNTAQIRERLPVWIQRYQPDIVVVWAGVNNAWNRADMENGDRPVTAWLRGLLSRVRLYRLARVWIHDRELAKYVPEGPDDRVWHRWRSQGDMGPRPLYEMKHDGVIEIIRHVRERPEADAEGTRRIAQSAERDLSFIAGYARSAGVELVFITYPLSASWFLTASQATLRAAEQHDVPVVETGPSVARLPVEDQDWLPDAHPGPHIYREIARDVAAAVLEAGGRSGADELRRSPED